MGRTRLGNVANGDAPRPAGACRVLMIGDLIGKPGRQAVEQRLPSLREARGIDFVTANGENVAGGMGLTPSTADAILAAGVDVITSRQPHLGQEGDLSLPRVVRPRAPAAQLRHARGPGPWLGHVRCARRFPRRRHQPPGPHVHEPIENPFTDADALLDESSAPEPLPPIRLVDFHCELTSEKNALGLHLDGRVSVVVGTHTHVVTGDERILPGGTAYQTDLGMTGPVWSVIGFDPSTVLPRFINALPTRFEVGEGAGRVQRDPDRHRSGHGSGARDRAHPAARRGLVADRPPKRSRRHGPGALDRAVVPPAPSTIDLHAHSTRSDGVLTPAALVRDVAAAGVTTFALTDHDTHRRVPRSSDAAARSLTASR